MAKRPSNRLVRKAIREIIVPRILDFGFAGKYPNFKRIESKEIHFFVFHTAKYGGSFGYTVGWCRNGPLDHWDEKIIPADEIEMAHLPFEQRASAHRMIDLWTLDGSKFRAAPTGFDYSMFVEDEEACRSLVLEAAETLPQAMDWLATRSEQDAIWPAGKQPPIGSSYELRMAIFNNKETARLRSLDLA